jgi:N-acetylmuramoyl-L-alanine amidase
MSARLAKTILHAIGGQGMKLRGVKADSDSQHSSLYVLRNTYKHMRSVLVEVGFMTNTTDAKMLLDKRWCESAAAVIAKTIVSP